MNGYLVPGTCPQSQLADIQSWVRGWQARSRDLSAALTPMAAAPVVRLTVHTGCQEY